MTTIKAERLVKRFGSITAVDSIDLDVREGEIYAFLGPNGAGKTTTVKMLTGVLKPTSGKVEILGMDMEEKELEIKRRIGVVPEEPRIYPFFKGFEFLNFIFDVFKLPPEVEDRMRDLLEAFGIDYLDKYISDMSHGMKQKLMLVSVLMREPDVIFLDEPTVGLDAKSAKVLKIYLRRLADRGKTIFMTTHILEIAEKMSDRIGIINKGRIVAEGTMEELREKVGGEDRSLEDLFLQLTGQEEEIRKILEELG